VTETCERPIPRIAVALRAEGNRSLIATTLGSDYTITTVPDTGVGEADPFDLVIADPGSLERHRAGLQAARSAAGPVVLPVLLVADGRRGPASWVRRELGSAVDDVIRIPTTRAELRARAANLLRLRRLSQDLQTRYEVTSRALAGTTRALRALNACNEVLVRARDEAELLEDVCRVIVAAEEYNLAWVGFVDATSEPEIRVRASAGPAADYIAKVRLDRATVGRGPAWRAIETGMAQTADHLPDEPAVRHYREELLEHELASVITLPLRPDIGDQGVLAIHSHLPGRFGVEERELLERMAANLEFGIGALRNAREREHQKARIEALAYSDPLTRLSNRNHMVERLDQLLDEVGDERSLAVLFIDLDHFKLINDALGHVAGDEVLRQVAHRLRQVVREGDLLARQGGDEFIIAMAEPPRSERGRDAAGDPARFGACARNLATRLVEKIREPLVVEGHERHLGASIGISLYPGHGRQAGDLIDRADTAMYTAKNGRDHVQIYSELISEHRQRRLSMEERLRRGLESDAFRLHYQPLFHLESGEIEGVEALLRWPQGDERWISPADFMPVAEETGLINSMGEWVLATAARQLADWRRGGLELRVAVNLSVQQLLSADSANRITALVGAHAEPASIELEVTEGVLMQDADAVETTLRTLHARGFRIAVDDFGTGYSSLSRLQNLPIDTLKIDMAFVSGLGGDGTGDAIVRTVQQLAENLGIRTLAEGVETDGQRRRLMELGCHWGQGFWKSPALPPDELHALAREPMSDTGDD